MCINTTKTLKRLKRESVRSHRLHLRYSNLPTATGATGGQLITSGVLVHQVGCLFLASQYFCSFGHVTEKNVADAARSGPPTRLWPHFFRPRGWLAHPRGRKKVGPRAEPRRGPDHAASARFFLATWPATHVAEKNKNTG